MLAEVAGGYLSGSLSLLADAGHMFSDAAALGLSLFAAWISLRPPTPQHSYGYYRAEILAALANGATLIAIAVFIFIEAVHRLNTPSVVFGPLMSMIAAGGLIVNIAGLAILNAGKTHSLNMHGAWLHLMTDALAPWRRWRRSPGVGISLVLGRPGGVDPDRPACDLFVLESREASHRHPDGSHARAPGYRRCSQCHGLDPWRVRSA